MDASATSRRATPSGAAWLIAGIWLLAFAGMCFSVLLATSEVPVQGFTRALLMAITGALLSAIIWKVGSRRRHGTMGRFVFFGVAILIATAVQVALDLWAAELIRVVGGFPEPVRRIISDNPVRTMLMNLLVSSNIFVFATAHAFFGMAAVALSAAVDSRERDRMLAEARAATSMAQLDALRYQLNPHFLFNTLNALQSLVESGRAADAGAMIDRLSDFLRSTLAGGTAGMSTLEDELATVQDYLAIEAVRFGERLTVRFDCPAEVRDALVPTFMLQPLVENALKHGVAPALVPVEVEIGARLERGDLLLWVKNDLHPSTDLIRTRGAGVGLRNTRERLSLAYGGAAELTTETGEGTFCAAIRMPLRMPAAA